MTTLSVSLFYQDWYQYSELEAAAYISLHKFAWSIANGWLVVACASGNGGQLEDIIVKFCTPIKIFQKLIYFLTIKAPIKMKNLLKVMIYVKILFPVNWLRTLNINKMLANCHILVINGMKSFYGVVEKMLVRNCMDCEWCL